MRFNQFIGPWHNFKVSELLTTFSTNSLSWNQLTYNKESSLKNLHYGLIHNGFTTTCISGSDKLLPYIHQSFYPTKYTLIKNGDLILADASEDRKDAGRPIEMINTNDQKIVSGLHTIHARNKTNLIVDGFKGFYFQSYTMKKQIHKIANGSKIYSISPSNFHELSMSIPSKDEQTKIVDLMIKIEKKIETQIKIIDLLQSQITYIKDYLLNNTVYKEIRNLDELCDITTGKRDANEMDIDGKYKFFTCSKEDYCINTYSFEGESLIISGNGELGLIKYYNGKFDAYQRTYVLQNFNCNPKYLMYNLQFILPRKIEKEKNVGAMPYIVLKTLTSIEIKIPDISEQLKIVDSIDKFESKLENENKILELLKKEKCFLLANLFV